MDGRLLFEPLLEAHCGKRPEEIELSSLRRSCPGGATVKLRAQCHEEEGGGSREGAPFTASVRVAATTARLAGDHGSDGSATRRAPQGAPVHNRRRRDVGGELVASKLLARPGASGFSAAGVLFGAGKARRCCRACPARADGDREARAAARRRAARAARGRLRDWRVGRRRSVEEFARHCSGRRRRRRRRSRRRVPDSDALSGHRAQRGRRVRPGAKGAARHAMEKFSESALALAVEALEAT